MNWLLLAAAGFGLVVGDSNITTPAVPETAEFEKKMEDDIQPNDKQPPPRATIYGRCDAKSVLVSATYTTSCDGGNYSSFD